MEIKKLKLLNFRNYDNLELEFTKKNTIFIGNNAQGKTNILEAVYVLGLTKSYLNINDKLAKCNCYYDKDDFVVVINNYIVGRELEINLV